jgi:VanZ family protein
MASKKSRTSRKKSTTKKSNSYGHIVYPILTILWMAMIFFMSAKNGEASSAMSNPITDVAVNLLEQIRNDDAAQVTALSGVMEVIVRKCAHMTEYAVLFVLLMNSFKCCLKSSTINFVYILSIAVSFLYASFDELHQLFVSERAGRCTDVLIDMIGVALAFFIILGTRNTKGKIVTGFTIAMIVVTFILFLMLWKF